MFVSNAFPSVLGFGDLSHAFVLEGVAEGINWHCTGLGSQLSSEHKCTMSALHQTVGIWESRGSTGQRYVFFVAGVGVRKAT